MRSFIALDLNEAVRQELSGLILQLKQSGADVKWTNPDNIHLTLKFLGHITTDKIEAVKKIVDAAVQSRGPFEMLLAEVGAFPKPSYPRVVWAGIVEGTDQVQQLYEFLQTALEREGFEREARPFSPHLTIGRVRSGKNKANLVSALKNLTFRSSHRITIDHITLFQSTLTPQGPIYTPLHIANFSL